MPRAPEYGSDLIVDLLLNLGIEYAAFNPGASFRGIHDSIVNYSGNRPRIVECTHEEISVAIAHGYAKAAGKPMVAIVHDVVGLQHATMAIFNAWCDRAPVLVLGGTGPMDTNRRRPWIDWIHTANVQATQVRDYTKWDDQPATLEAVPESLIRAMQLATTPPHGPVYVCFDTEIQEQPMHAGFPRVDVTAFSSPARLAPDRAAVRQVAEWLIGAERPVAIAARIGRTQCAVDLLVELADLLALPVIDDRKVTMSFPSTHPMNLSGAQAELLPGADVVLGLESHDLFGALHATDRTTRQVVPSIRQRARIAHVTLDMFVTRSWSGDYQRLQPADLTIPADAAAFLEDLLQNCRDLLAGETQPGDRIQARRSRLVERSAELRRNWREQATAASASSGPVATATLAAAVWDCIKNREFVLANGTLNDWTHRLWSIERTDQYLGQAGGAGLGYGLGASIGAALAHRGSDRVIVNIQSDGDALFTPGAFWTMAQHDLPILTVMDNNRSYQNSVEHAERMARVRQRPLENRGVGTDISAPNVDFATLARSFGVHGEGPVETMAELRPALEGALRVVVEQRKPALVDVVRSRVS